MGWYKSVFGRFKFQYLGRSRAMRYSGFSHQSSAQSIIFTGNVALFSDYFLAFQMLALIYNAWICYHNIFQSNTYLHPPIHICPSRTYEKEKGLASKSSLSNRVMYRYYGVICRGELKCAQESYSFSWSLFESLDHLIFYQLVSIISSPWTAWLLGIKGGLGLFAWKQEQLRFRELWSSHLGRAIGACHRGYRGSSCRKSGHRQTFGRGGDWGWGRQRLNQA